jgi:DNA-binding CsgD family transcriptional regulator
VALTSRTARKEAGLLERDAELRACRELIVGVREGRGGLLMLEGPAGTGKSALLERLRRAAPAAGVRVLFTRGTELGRSVPFGVARRLLEPLVREQPDLLDVGLAMVARPVFGGPFDDAGGTPSPLVNGLITLLHAALAGPRSPEAERLLMLVVDDLQWVDGASLLFLTELAERIDEIPVGVALGIRSGEPPADAGLVHRIRGAPGSRVLEPRALSESAIARVLDRELGDGHESSVPLVARLTAGNPLLVGELVATARARGGELRDGRPLDGVLEAVVPARVAHSVRMRLEPLGEDVLALAQAAALLSEASLHRVAQLAGLGRETAEAAADALATRGILAPGEPVRFKHPLMAAAILSSVAPFRRSAMHRRAAELLASAGEGDELVAAHLLGASAQGDPWATGVLRGAARSALARGDPTTAACLLGRALAEPPPPGERGMVLIELARAQALAGDAGAIERFQTALEHLSDRGLRGDAWHGLARMLALRQDLEGAAQAAIRGRSERPSDDPQAERLLADELAVVVLLPERAAEARARSRELVRAVRAGAPPSAPTLLAHLALHLGWCGEDLDLVVTLARRAVAADPLIDPEARGVPPVHAAGALNWVDDLEASASVLDDALVRAGEVGDTLAQATLRCTRGWTHYYAGELAAAERQLELVIADATGWDLLRGLAATPLALVALERDDLPRAQAQITLAPRAPMAGFGWISGRVSLAAGDARAALDACTGDGELLESVGMRNPNAVPWRSVAALAAWRLGEDEHARELADAELRRARELGVARGVGVALRGAALCSPRDVSLKLMEESVAALETSPSRLELVRSLVDLGSVQRRAGQVTSAGATLTRALELAVGMGALALARQARQELRASGARPRRAARTGPAALTISERRVAELAAGGSSTRAIAAELFLSPRTVDGHLANVYRKLGIGSRREIASKLEPGHAESAPGRRPGA